MQNYNKLEILMLAQGVPNNCRSRQLTRILTDMEGRENGKITSLATCSSLVSLKKQGERRSGRMWKESEPDSSGASWLQMLACARWRSSSGRCVRMGGHQLHGRPTIALPQLQIQISMKCLWEWSKRQGQGCMGLEVRRCKKRQGQHTWCPDRQQRWGWQQRRRANPLARAWVHTMGERRLERKDFFFKKNLHVGATW